MGMCDPTVSGIKRYTEMESLAESFKTRGPEMLNSAAEDKASAEGPASSSP